jgi:hypothetical protein
MPAVSKKQEKFMQAVAHNKDFAKKVDVPQSVGREFTKKEGDQMNRMKSKGEHPVQKKAKKGAEMVKMAKGGGVEIKGKTKGKMVKMAGGGKACK